jgi:hypothetical protein
MDSGCLMLSCSQQSSHRSRLQSLLFVDQTDAVKESTVTRQVCMPQKPRSSCRDLAVAVRRWLLVVASEKTTAIRS